MSKIKRRLRAAYDNVEFYANKTWVYNSHAYQRANQELYVRECKVQDAIAEEPTYPRTVQDKIPQSRLAQYNNYEYNESRELCYASSVVNDISFYYPCIYKRDSVKEPWMLPETEQIFIWLTYSCDFDLLQSISMEELNHLEDQEKLKSGRKHTCTWNDFHEVCPMFTETIEKTPGKPRYTCADPVTEAELAKFVPPLYKVETFEDMILKMAVNSDKVKSIWNQNGKCLRKSHVNHSPHLTTEKFDYFKSPLGNFFVFENSKERNKEYQYQDHLRLLSKETWLQEYPEELADFGQIQLLSETFKILQSWLLKTTNYHHHRQSAQAEYVPSGAKAESESSKAEPVPTRRLYSAVLQGLSSDKKTGDSMEIASPPSGCTTSTTKETSSSASTHGTPPKTTISSCVSNDSSTLTSTHKAGTSGYLRNAPFISPPTPPIHWLSPVESRESNYDCLPTQFAQIQEDQVKSALSQTNFTVQKPKTPPQRVENLNCTSKITSSSLGNTYINNCYVDNYSNNTFSTCSNNDSYSNMVSYPTSANTFGCNTNSAHYGNSSSYGNNAYYNTCYNTGNYSNNSYIANSYQYNSTNMYTNFQNSTSYPTNSFSNNTYVNNIVYSSNASTSRNLMPQYTRQTSYNPNPIHAPSPVWLMQQHRAPTVYSVSHYPPQPYLILSTPPPPRQNQRWTQPQHYVRPTTSQSYHVPVTPPHNPNSPPPQQQHWQAQNQSMYKSSSSQQMSYTQQQYYENSNGTAARLKIKSRKVATTSQINLLQHKQKCKSPGSSCHSLETASDSIEVCYETYGKNNANSSFESKRSSGCSEPIFVTGDKSFIIKTNSNSSLSYKSTVNNASDKKELRKAFVEGAKCFSKNSDDPTNLLLPVTSSNSADLERQALEQYQPSNDNFYRELERQAEEQYEDLSENLISPPNERLSFGGLNFQHVLAMTNNCFILFLVVYVNTHVCNYCLFHLS